MGYEELIQDLNREAERKREAVLKAVREEAGGMMADAKNACDRLERDFQEALAREAEHERTRRLNQARREAKAALARASADVAHEIFRRLEERLAAAASTEQYPSVLKRLWDEALPEWPAGEVTIRADERTASLIKPWAAGRPARFETVRTVDEKEAPWGGFELQGGGGRVIRNTFRSRLAKARPELLVEIRRLLFENPPAG